MKKKANKFIAMGLTMALGASILAGCGGDEKSKGGKTNLSVGIWDTNQKATLEKMIKAYTEENPDVSIEIQLTPWKDYWTKLEASATGGTCTAECTYSPEFGGRTETYELKVNN